VGCPVRRLQLRLACGRLARKRTDHVVREVHPRHRDAADVRGGVPAGYRSAFYAPLVSDWRNYGSWAEDGAKTATERASAIWQSTLERYVPPPRDPAIVEALNEFVDRRTAEGGAPPVS
jgi:hypothetical protein